MADPRIKYDVLANAQGEEDVRRLADALDKVDDAIDPAAAQRANKLAQELRNLGQQQAALDTFTRLLRETQAAKGSFGDAQAAVEKFAQKIGDVEKPTRAQTGQLEKLRDAVKASKREWEQKTQALATARGEMGTLGVATTGLAGTEDRLRVATAAARKEVAQLGQQGQAVQQFQALAGATDTASKRLQAADSALEAYRRSLGSTEAPTRSQQQQLAKLAESARQAQIAYQSSAQAQAQAATQLRAAGVDTQRLVTTQSQLPPKLTATATAARQVAGGYTEAGTAAKTSAAQQAAASDKIDQGLQGIAGRLNGLRNLGIGAILGSQTAQMLRGVTETADAFNNLRARIQLVTGEGPALQQALQGVEQIALSTGQSLESTGTLFTRILTAGKEIGLVQADALALTESINQAVVISGASAGASDAAITQLIQGLQSGVLRGEEFNSVMEQAPRLAQALADGLGVTRGQLRGLAQDGKLTSQQVIEALQSQRGALETEFGKLPATVGRALENLQTRWTTFVGSLDAGTGATASVAAGINAIANNLDDLAGIAERAGSVLVAALAVQGVAALRSLAAQTLSTAGTMAVLSKSIADVPKVVNIAVAVVGFEVAYQLGDVLRENSEWARKFGVATTEFMVGIVNDLQFLKDAAAAVFSDDTIGAAFDRFKQRAEEQAAIFSDLYREAEQAPSAVRAAAMAAAQATEDLGKKAQGTGATIATAGATGAAGVGSVGKAAEDAASAIGVLAAAAQVKLPPIAKTAQQQAAAMADLAAKSKDAAQRIGDEIPKAIAKLSGPELQRFRDTFVGALGSATDKAGLLQRVLVETGRRAAQALGVDVARATATLSEEFVAAQDNLALLVRSVDALKSAGLDAGRVVGEALRKMADTTRSQAEIDALRARVEALGKAGVISRDQVRELLDVIRTKAEEAAKGLDKLAEAYRFFGLTGRDELQRVAAESARQWALIRTDATLSLEQKQAAFRRYASDAIAANGGVADSSIKSEAQALKVAIQVDKTGKATVAAMGEAAKAVDEVAKKFNDLGREINQYGEEVNQLAGNIGGSVKGIQGGPANSVLGPSKIGKTGSSDFNIDTQVPVPAGHYYTLDPYDPNVVRPAGTDSLGRPYGGYFARIPGSAGNSGNGASYSSPFGGYAGSTQQRSGTPEVGGAPSKVVRVDINVNGKTVQVPTTESAAEQLLRELELAQGSGA
jgi:tape measure domain-containing protein